MKKIIYKTESGVCIIHPTDEQWLENVFDKDVPEQYKFTAQIVDKKNVTTDRTFRDAWEIKADKVVTNINKAKQIHKERLRADRKPLLEEQDVAYMKALEDGLPTTEIVAEKKRLRDITKEVDKCETIEAIKAVKCK